MFVHSKEENGGYIHSTWDMLSTPTTVSPLTSWVCA